MKKQFKTFVLILVTTFFMCGFLNLLPAAESSYLMMSNEDGTNYIKTVRKKKKKKIVEVTRETAAVEATQIVDPNQNVQVEKNSEVVENSHSEEHISSSESYTYPHWSDKLKFTVTPSFMTVEGTQFSNNSRGILNSKLFYNFKIDYTHMTENWMFGLITGYKEVTFENSIDRTLITPSHKLFRNDILFGRRVTKELTLGVGAGYEDKFFYKVMNSSFADIDTGKDYKVYGFFDYNFLRYKTYTGSTNVKVGFNPKTSSNEFESQTGVLYSVVVKAEKFIAERQKIGVEVFMKNEHYKTKQLDLKASEIGIGVSYSFDWGSI